MVLEDQTDHSGVRVSLYLPAELDPEMVELNQKYPHVGVPIFQHTEFDHRLAMKAATTTTAADGSFEPRDVAQGQCVLVAQKEGFGWKYIFNVSPFVSCLSVPGRWRLVGYWAKTLSGNGITTTL